MDSIILSFFLSRRRSVKIMRGLHWQVVGPQLSNTLRFYMDIPFVLTNSHWR